MLGPGRSPRLSLLLAWSGAAVFGISLLFFLYVYLVRFGLRVDDGPVGWPVAVNVLLFTVFALHHSVLARSAMKARLSRMVTPELERSTYTWTASLLFIAVCAWWQPVPGALYALSSIGALAGYGVQALGIALTVRSATRLDVLDLAGVRQVLVAGRDREAAHPTLETRGLYGLVRHPLYMAWLLLVFGTPHMTMTRLVFAVVSTAYVAIAIPFEERSLIRTFGDEYRAYQQHVRWRMIPGVY